MQRLARNKKGLALLVAMFFEVVLFMLVLSFFRLVPVELTSARRDHVKAQSYYFSNAMAQQVWAWLCYAEESTGNPLTHLTGSNTGDAIWPRVYPISHPEVPGFLPQVLLSGGGSPNADWTAQVDLYPDPNTEAGYGPHVFRVKVVSIFSGQPISAHEYLLYQQTFAKYGFFVDKPPSSGFYTAMVNDVYEGEFHINGKLPLYVDSKLFSNFVTPVFRGDVTFTAPQTTNPWDSVNYVSGSAKPFDSAGNVIVDADGTDRYSKMFASGRSALRLESDVAMPRTDTNSELPLAKAAWFGRNARTDSLAAASIAPGLNLRRLDEGDLSGLYIKGNVREMILDVLGPTGDSLPRDPDGLIQSGNPVLRIQEEAQASAGQELYTRVVELRDSTITFTVPANSNLSVEGAAPTVNPQPVPLANNKTVIIRDPGTQGNPGPLPLYQVYDGFPNGVTFVDGNIGRIPSLNNEAAGGSTVNRDYMRNSTDPSSSSASLGGIKGLNYGAARTIGVNSAHNNYIRLAGDITRGDAVPGQVPDGRRDGLGLVAYDIVVGGEIPRLGDSKPFYLYSLIFAGRRDLNEKTQPGSVIYENWDTIAGWGRLFSFGSYVVGNDRLWGNNGSKGWMPTFRHDAALANSPPPFYPTRGDYSLQSYREVALP